MEFFERAVRMKGSRGKYLCAKDNRLVSQERNREERATIWIVEKVTASQIVRLKSINNLYLTALEEAFLLGEKGNKVQESYSSKADSAVEWEPIYAGKNQINLRTKRGTYLRANRGIPPYTNSVTHDSTNKAITTKKFLWEVEIAVDIVDKLPIEIRSFQISTFQEEKIKEYEDHSSSKSPQQQLSTDSDRRDHGSSWGSRMRHPDPPQDNKETSILKGNRTPHAKGNTLSVPSTSHEKSACGRESTMMKAAPLPPTRRHISLEDVEESVKRLIDSDDCSSSTSSDVESEHKVSGPARDSESRLHAISSDETERRTRISSKESDHKGRTRHDREGGWRPIFSDGTGHGTRMSCDMREEKKQAPRTTQHTLRPRSSGETEHGTRISSNESEHTLGTLAVKREARVHPRSSDDDDDDEHESKIYSEEREQRLKISPDRERILCPISPGDSERVSSTSADKKHRSSSGNRMHRLTRVSIDIEERRSGISIYDDEQGLRVCTVDKEHRARNSFVEHRERVHSGKRGHGFDERQIKSRMTSGERGHGSRNQYSDYRNDISAIASRFNSQDGEGYNWRNSSSEKGPRPRILSDDEECSSARIPFDHTQHKFSSKDTERELESPVASPELPRLTLSLDDEVEKELTRRKGSLDDRKPKIAESPLRHQDSVDDEQQNSSRTLPSSRSRGRMIFFTVADEHGEYSTTHEERFMLKSSSVSGSKQELQIHTKIEDIFVCIRNPINGKLCILTLELPPDNVSMRVVVVRADSEVGRKLWNPQRVPTR